MHRSYEFPLHQSAEWFYSQWLNDIALISPISITFYFIFQFYNFKFMTHGYPWRASTRGLQWYQNCFSMYPRSKVIPENPFLHPNRKFLATRMPVMPLSWSLAQNFTWIVRRWWAYLTIPWVYLLKIMPFNGIWNFSHGLIMGRSQKNDLTLGHRYIYKKSEIYKL